jgi:iron complex transport system substrate-binding protein
MNLKLKMIVYAFLSFAGIATADPAQSNVRTIVDMAGRTVTIPATIKSVYTIGPVGEIILYTLAPGKLIGKTWNIGSPQTDLLTEEYLKKPVLGGWYGKTTGNPEVIIKAHPDIILSVEHRDMVSTDRIKEKLGLPVVQADCGLASLDTMYRFIGSVIGETARADTLARYCRATLDLIASGVAKIPEAEKVRIYYAEGLHGLETDPQGTMHTEVIDMVGGLNVAAGIAAEPGYGRGTVSFEQLLLWKPQIVLVCLDHQYAGGSGSFARITSDPNWASLDAIKRKNVYCIPSIPFNWIDRPPSVNRIIGLKWLANLLYPKYFPMNIREETKTFYRLFYHRNLTDAELNKVLENATRN